MICVIGNALKRIRKEFLKEKKDVKNRDILLFFYGLLTYFTIDSLPVPFKTREETTRPWHHWSTARLKGVVEDIVWRS